MKITPELLEKQWNGIGYTDGGFLQIDTEHPLEWHIGFQSISQRTLLLVCDIEIGAIESSKSLMVSRRRRETNNRWTLSFELLRNEQQGVFAILCCDVIEHSRSAANEAEALKLVIGRYKQWSKLLEGQRSGLMDENRRKGLVGELLFLEDRITDMESTWEAVQGWSGADGADQDFMYADGWYEIKSVGASAVNVSISSLQQLDCADDGELIIYRIDKVAPDRPGAFSLNEIVRQISGLLIGTVEAFDLFQAKLNSYGYIDLQEYSEQKYYYSAKQRYCVDGSFPRLTAKNVPTQVAALHYELSLPALVNWERK
jgi:hypothetical protein